MSSEDDFPSTTNHSYQEIMESKINYRLEFVIDDFYYIVKLPEGLPYTHILDKASSLLEIYEINGAEDGIYTWILIDDRGIKKFYFKQNLDVTELGTKHTDMLKEICKTNIENGSATLESVISVYFAGELKKSTKRSGRITYDLNFLSGSYSEGRIHPTEFSERCENQLKTIFKAGLCERGDCENESTINILRTTETMIKLHDSHEKFEHIMKIIYIPLGVNVYKFANKKLYNRSKNLCDSIYKAKLQLLEQKIKKFKQLKFTEEQLSEIYEKDIQELNEYFKPLTEEELEEYRIKEERGGGKNRTKRRKLKNGTKRRKSKNRK